MSFSFLNKSKCVHTLMMIIVCACSIKLSAEKFSYVKEGVFYLGSEEEVKHLGVNYSPAFAFTYRALNGKGLNHKDIIDMDIAHLKRLGLDAYRIHVWEKEISDKDGNLKNNIHLDLLDYTIAKFIENDFKVILTPISWWGNGYPEPDQLKGSFSDGYSKNDMNEKEALIKASESYLTQFINHTNQYTGKSYKDDENIIAYEIFNEPKHRNKPKEVIKYINRLSKALRDAGAKVPLFYNISEQGLDYDYAKAVCASNIDGISYQWYPTGLVRGSEITMNTLLNVSKYTNPFANIETCSDKAKMIYEFDSADTNLNGMYPAMARSFRMAGFQWATQFAYDSAMLANSNAEYHTHYMNLLYTPKKAIALAIAAETFRTIPKNYAAKSYPENNNFNGTKINPIANTVVLSHAERFYYTGDNTENLKKPSKLKSIKGVGSSNVVEYTGTGAYFIDKLSHDSWILEVYPDVYELEDPYKQPSLKNKVRNLALNINQIKLRLPNLAKNYFIHKFENDIEVQSRADDSAFLVSPGRYIISNAKISDNPKANNEMFLIPEIDNVEQILTHDLIKEYSSGRSIRVNVKLQGRNITRGVKLFVRYKNGKDYDVINMPMMKYNTFTTAINLKGKWSNPGVIEYAFLVDDGDNFIGFPGNITANIKDWDLLNYLDFYEFNITKPNSPITLYSVDNYRQLIYPNGSAANWKIVPGEHSIDYALRLSQDRLTETDDNFLSIISLDRNYRLAEAAESNFKNIVIKVRAVDKESILGLDVTDEHGFAYGMEFVVTPSWNLIKLPIESFKPQNTALTKAYPMFMPKTVANISNENSISPRSLANIQSIQLRLPSKGLSKLQRNNWFAVDIESIYLTK